MTEQIEQKNIGSMSNKENEGSDRTVLVKVKLSADMHKRLKSVAAERGGTLQGLVVQILSAGVKVGAELIGAVEPGMEVKPKQMAVVDGGGREAAKRSAYTNEPAPVLEARALGKKTYDGV